MSGVCKLVKRVSFDISIVDSFSNDEVVVIMDGSENDFGYFRFFICFINNGVNGSKVFLVFVVFEMI